MFRNQHLLQLVRNRFVLSAEILWLSVLQGREQIQVKNSGVVLSFQDAEVLGQLARLGKYRTLRVSQSHGLHLLIW